MNNTGYSKRRWSIIAASYIIAAFCLMGGFILQERAVAESYRMQVDQGYQRAFSEFVTAATKLETSLHKSRYLTSPGMMSSACAEVFARAEAAQMALGILPFSDTELEHTASFISKTGDYAYMLSKKAASGEKLTDEEYSNLVGLAQCAELLSGNLTNLYADVQSGLITIERSKDKLGKSDDGITPSALADSFFSMESEFPEVPSLIYDGPFSEHITGMETLYIKDKPEIDELEAKINASEFTGFEKARFQLEYIREGEIPVYVLSTRLSGGDMIVEVTKRGGVVARVNHARPVSESTIPVKDAVRFAERFISSRGYKSMKTSYYQIEGNKVTVNFAYTQDGVICYPDLVKVTVALDSGSIVGFENDGYIMNHTQRQIPEPVISAEDAQAKVSGELKVLSHELAIIPTSGKHEVFCHEFKCENADGQHYIVYINAQTGNEEKLLILIEDENGTLTL